MNSSWRLGRIAGVEVRVDPSWIVALALFTVIFWNRFADPIQFPGLAGGTALLLAVVTSCLFFGSVLAHELAHATMSKARRIPVRDITLFMFGGATSAEIESRGPADEFLVTVVGPLTSLGIGAVFLLGHVLGRDSLPRPIWLGVFGIMAYANVLIGLFNLLPGFPLDGGRLLRSALWRATRSLERATRIAARVGQVVALLIVAGGVWLGIRDGNLLDGLWPALVGSFLFRAAGATLASAQRQRLLGSATARQVMSSPPPTIAGDLPLGTAIERYLRGHEGEAFPVMTADRGVAGFVSLRTALGVPPDQPVVAAMVGLEGVTVAGPEDRMTDVVARMGAGPRRTVLVVDAGRLVGVIEPEDLARFLRRGAPVRP